MSSGQNGKHASWAYAEAHGADDDVFAAARLQAVELGAAAVSEGTAAALTVFSAAAGSKAMVEIGTGVGLSAAALLRGAPHAVLTSIDPDPECAVAARQLLRAEGVGSSKTRLITGRAQEVLPRLTAGGYDLVFVDGEPEDAPAYADQGLRLLRSGGLLLINDALDGDRLPKPAVRQTSTQAMRAAELLLKDRKDTFTALIPTGTGLLVAVKK